DPVVVRGAGSEALTWPEDEDKGHDGGRLEGQPSRTAERVAIERAAHQILDFPLVLVDPLAIRLLSPRRAAGLQAHPKRHDTSPISKPTRALVVVRSRMAESEIPRLAHGPAQYILLGAGFDTFGYRSPHPSVRVF